MTKELTIGLPVFNEEPLIGEFLEGLDRICAALPDYAVEALIVDDGSRDGTVEALKRVRTRAIRRIRLIGLNANRGHAYAVQCLVDHLASPWNILMDADFQDDPALIPRMIELAAGSGAEIVRVARTGQRGGWFQRLCFYGFRSLYRQLSHEKQSFGTFGLYSAAAIQDLRRFQQEAHPYFPGFVSLVGRKTETLSAPRPARKQGVSRMGLWRLWALGFDAIFSFSALPIRLASLLGLLILFLSLAAIGVIVWIRLFTPLAIPGWSSILVAVTFFGGVQLLFLGILGEYIARTFEQTKQRPHYFIASDQVLECGPHAPASA